MAKRALGTTISINGVLIGGLTSIKPPEKSAETIETTTLDSSTGYKDFIQGFKDGGEVEIEGWYDTLYTGQSNLDTAYESGTQDTYVITFPAAIGATYTFTGIVVKLADPGEANTDDPLKFNATIKVLGKPVLGTTPSAGLTALSLTGTGGALTPSFSGTTYSYAFSGVTGTSVTVTATGAGTLKLFIDGVYSQDLVSAAASNAIAMSAVGSKKLTIVQCETGKTPKSYDIVVVKTS